MLGKMNKILISALIALGLLLPGMANKAEAKGKKKKAGFFTRMKRQIKRDVKRISKKTKRAIAKAGAKVENGVMDSAVKAKSAITGKKPKKVWVSGHYKKGNKHMTKGHFSKRKRHHHSSGGSSGGNFPAPAPAPAPAPTGPSAPPPTGEPLPPVDPALP